MARLATHFLGSQEARGYVQMSVLKFPNCSLGQDSITCNLSNDFFKGPGRMAKSGRS